MIPVTQSLRQITAATVLPLIPDTTQRLVLIDPPDYPNVGDSAILIGEVDFLRAHRPKARCAFVDRKFMSPNSIRRLEAADMHLLQGGGNFGDIWKDCHDFRLEIMDRYPSVPKVQFPQSLHFSDEKYLEKTKRIIAKQKDFTLLVRDRISLEFAEKNFDCATHLCPDMAFSINSRARVESDYDIFMLMRTDKEKTFEDLDMLRSKFAHRGLATVIEDWNMEDSTPIKKIDFLLSRRGCGRLGSLDVYADIALAARLRYAQSRVKIGMKMLGSGKTVVTDRLHGMILSTILGRPTFVFDSYDGKVSAFHESWLKPTKRTRLVASTRDMLDQMFQGSNEASL